MIDVIDAPHPRLRAQTQIERRPPGAPCALARPQGLRVLVCGGRDFHDDKWLDHVLDELHRERGFGLVVHGNAIGADRLAGAWADKRQIAVCCFPANWSGLGKAAGPIRNQYMLDWGMPDLVVAFPGGTGTADMKRRATAMNIEIVEI